MTTFAVLFLCAVSRHTLGSTLKPLQEMSMEDAVLSLIKQMSNVEEKILILEKKECFEENQKIKDELLMEIKSSEQRFVENKNEIASKLEQVLARMSEIEKSSSENDKRCNAAIGDVSDRLQVETKKLLLMNNHLLAEVLELRKRDLDTFEKIANVESEVRDRVTLEQGKKIQDELLVEIKRVERNYLEDKNEQSSKLEQVLHKISEIEKSSNVAIGDVSDRLQVEKNELLLMNNNLSAEVLELQKRDVETFVKIADVQNEVRMRTDLLQVRLNETANMTHSCLASQMEVEETMQKNFEALESNLSPRMGNVSISLEALRKDLDDGKVIVQNNTNDIGQLKQELSLIQNCIIGVKYENEKFENMSKDIMKLVDSGAVMVVEIMFRPWLYSDFLFHLSKFGKKYLKIAEEGYHRSREVMNELENELFTEGSKEIKSCGKMLAKLHLQDRILSEKDVRDHLMNFAVAGYDTVAITMMWCLYVLGHHPEVQEKACNEVVSIASEGDFTYEDLAKMKYLECVLKETMRLYSTVPLISRKAKRDIAYGDYIIPKGAEVFFFIFMMHRDPNVFPEPEKFDPERFSDNSNLRPWMYLPFSEGYRSCIGKKFAMLEMKVQLAHLLRRFKVTSLNKIDDSELENAVILKPTKPPRLLFEHRH